MGRQRCLRFDTKTMTYKGKENDKLDVIEIKKFCFSNVTVKSMKIKATNLGGETIFTKNISDKGLEYRIYKYSSDFNKKKINNPIKMGR